MEFLEVLGTWARISVDILELGRFPSWQGGQEVLGNYFSVFATGLDCIAGSSRKAADNGN